MPSFTFSATSLMESLVTSLGPRSAVSLARSKTGRVLEWQQALYLVHHGGCLQGLHKTSSLNFCA